MQRMSKQIMQLITLCLCLMTTFVEAPGGTREGDGPSGTGDASGAANPAGGAGSTQTIQIVFSPGSQAGQLSPAAPVAAAPVSAIGAMGADDKSIPGPSVVSYETNPPNSRFKDYFAISFERANGLFSVTTLSKTFIAQILDNDMLNLSGLYRTTECFQETNWNFLASGSYSSYTANNDTLKGRILRLITEKNCYEQMTNGDKKSRFLIVPYYIGVKPLNKYSFGRPETDAIKNIASDAAAGLEVEITFNEQNTVTDIKPISLHGPVDYTTIRNLGQQLGLMYIHLTVAYDQGGGSYANNQQRALEKAMKDVKESDIKIPPNTSVELETLQNELVNGMDFLGRWKPFYREGYEVPSKTPPTPPPHDS